MDAIEVDIDDKADAVMYNEEPDDTEPKENSVSVSRKRDRSTENVHIYENDLRCDYHRSQKRHNGRQRDYYQDKRPPRMSYGTYQGAYEKTNHQYRRNYSYRQSEQRSHYQGSRKDSYFRQSLGESEKIKEIEAKLVYLLDSFETAKEDIISLSETLARLPDDCNQSFLPTLIKCVESFPTKTGAYASIVGILKAKGKFDVVEAINQQVLYNFGRNLLSGNRTVCVLLLRFLLSLHCANVTSNNVYDIISTLLRLARELCETKFENQHDFVVSTISADNIYYIVLASIPWFSRGEFSINQGTIESICEEIFNYNVRRQKWLESLAMDLEFNEKVDACDDAVLGNPYAYMSCFSCINDGVYSDRFTSGVEFLKSILRHKLTSSVTYRFYQSEGMSGLIGEATKDSQDIANINKITTDNFKTILQLDAKSLSSFKPIAAKAFKFDVDLEPSEMLSQHDQWLLEEHIANTVEIFQDYSSRCALQLLNIPVNQAYKEYAIVDVLLNMMLSSLYKHHYTLFGTLVLQAMYNMENKIEEIFSSMLSKLIGEINSLDVDVINSILTVGSYWFSVEFCKIRKPDTAKDEMQLDSSETAKVDREMIKTKNKELFSLLFKQDSKYSIHNFNARLLEKISRLIYVDRLLAFSPEELCADIKASIRPSDLQMQSILKEKPLEHQLFLNLLHFNALSPEENDLRNGRIIGFINSYTKSPPLKELPSHLFSENRTLDIDIDSERPDTPSDPNSSNEKLWTSDELILLFWETLLIFGSKSLTHLLRLLEFHGSVLKEYQSQEGLPFEDTISSKVLAQTFKTFNKDSKKIELTVEFLIRKNILSPVSVFKFIFKCLPSEEFVSNHTLWILDSALSLAESRLQKHEESYKFASRDLSNATIAESMKKELDTAKSDYYGLIFTVVGMVDDKMKGTWDELQLFLSSFLKNILVRFAIKNSVFPQLYMDHIHGETHKTVKQILHQLYLSRHIASML